MMSTFFRNAFITVIIMTLVLILLYLYKDKETLELNADARSKLGGTYIQLQNGVVHYELSEKPKHTQQPTVVLVHGFSSPLYVFEPTYTYLKQNYQVLRFDLFGRGFSDRIDSDYGIDLYVKQLHELLSALDIKGEVNLVGLSMGGAIVTHFTNRYPQKVNKISLIDPLIHTPDRPELRAVKLPGLGEYLVKVVMVPKFINGVAESVHDPRTFPDWSRLFEVQTNYMGFSKALLQTARHLAGKNYKDQYQALGQLGKPVQLFWGMQDKVIPISDAEKIKVLVPGLEFHAIDNAGHLPHYEQAATVSPLISQFFAH